MKTRSADTTAAESAPQPKPPGLGLRKLPQHRGLVGVAGGAGSLGLASIARNEAFQPSGSAGIRSARRTPGSPPEITGTAHRVFPPCWL